LIGSVATGAAALFLVGMVAPGAGAAPVKAKSAFSGTFSDCSNGASGTFVVNSGRSEAPNWSVAHLTLASGQRGIFSATSLDLTFTVDGQVVGTDVRSKHAKRGAVTCSIEAVLPDGTLAGTVVGKMTINGKK
jgi:hypothetical protein